MDQGKQIGQQFCQAYYSTLQSNRSGLVQFYGTNSIMNYNGSTAIGLKEIAEKVESFSFEKVFSEIADPVPNQRLGRATVRSAQQSPHLRFRPNADGPGCTLQVLPSLPHPPQQPGRLLLPQRHLQTCLLKTIILFKNSHFFIFRKLFYLRIFFLNFLFT